MPSPDLDPEPATEEDDAGGDAGEWLTVQLIAPPPARAWAVFVSGPPDAARITTRPVDYFAVQHLMFDDEAAEEDAGPAGSRVVPIMITEIGAVVPLMLDPEAADGSISADFVGLSHSAEAAQAHGRVYVEHLAKSLTVAGGGES